MIYALLMLIIPSSQIVIERQSMVIQAEVTAYNAVHAQTDSTPDIVASGKKAKVGMAACPSWLEFGREIKVDGKQFTCEDRMARRYRDGNYFDILVESKKEAMEWGRRTLAIQIIK